MAPRNKALPLAENSNRKPRKPRTPKTKPAAQPPKEPVVPMAMALNESERLRIRTYLAEYRRYNMEASMLLQEKQALLRQLDPDNKLGLLDQGIRAASENAAKAQQHHNNTLADVEKRLGINIREFSFDEETGRLWPHNAVGKKE